MPALVSSCLLGAQKAFLKAKSPSWGLRTPDCDPDTAYGVGVTGALLFRNGIEVIEVDAE
jgi:uncharacterized protein YbbK (DUF523 family)